MILCKISMDGLFLIGNFLMNQGFKSGFKHFKGLGLDSVYVTKAQQPNTLPELQRAGHSGCAAVAVW